ncbi:hypothetical protein AM587_10011924 [Phytophthora nicotianae]|uniref:Uncharacterized protein n=1 Tax=Phytophthora nicotianae TaxID=4792 RepID=A0A0W8E114_PHYNI|nr:hypothetical protein AM587_10011924 [Phytophthora nicotianae]
MRKLYIGVAAHTACANESTVDKYEVENLEEALPDCNYYLKDYENSNKKWEAYASLAHCDQRNASDPVAVRFHSNSTITILTPSSASGSAVMDEVSMSSNSNSDFVDNSPAMGTQMSWIGAAFIAAHINTDILRPENQSITDAYAAAAATSACSSYASTNILILITPPCSARDCVGVMTDLANTIPNCTSPGLSTTEKDQLLRSLDICATPAPTPASTASSTNCTSSQAEATFNAFYEAANGTCASSTTIEQYSIIIDTPCTSTCAETVHSFAQSLPNCNYQLSNENRNKKQDIATQFSYCEMLDNATNISVYVDSVDNLLGSAAGVTTVDPNCTAEEIEETVAFYLTVATNESCMYDASICAYDIHVNADCASPCGRLARRLGYDVPRCYFNHKNHRESLSGSWYQCEWIVNPVNISFSFHYSDILNATVNSSVSCDPDYDSTVASASEDNSLGDSSAQTDSGASQGYTVWTATLVALVALAMQL